MNPLCTTCSAPNIRQTELVTSSWTAMSWVVMWRCFLSISHKPHWMYSHTHCFRSLMGSCHGTSHWIMTYPVLFHHIHQVPFLYIPSHSIMSWPFPSHYVTSHHVMSFNIMLRHDIKGCITAAIKKKGTCFVILQGSHVRKIRLLHLSFTS